MNDVQHTNLVVAARGPMAVRIIRTAQELGMRTVAVYAGDELNALHVRLADAAYALPADAHMSGADGTERMQDAILGIEQRSGADAVLYGCQPAQVSGALAAARDDPARRVEVHLLIDGAGTSTVIGLSESTVRVRDTVRVYEAPAPYLHPHIAQQLRGTARQVARDVPRHGIVTVSFAVSPEAQLRGRASVADAREPKVVKVTCGLPDAYAALEQTTGVDLVRAHLAHQFGRHRHHQQEFASRGHAVTFRMRAEDPALGFLPSPGRLTACAFPAGPGVRVDTGVDAGDALALGVDTHLADVTVTGLTRDTTLSRARRALRELQVSGVPTTLPLHERLLADPAFTAQNVGGYALHTHWVEHDSGLVFPVGEKPAPAAPLTRFTVEMSGNAHTVGVSEEVRRLLGTVLKEW